MKKVQGSILAPTPTGRSHYPVVGRMSLPNGDHMVVMRRDAFDAAVKAAGRSIKTGPAQTPLSHTRRDVA